MNGRATQVRARRALPTIAPAPLRRSAHAPLRSLERLWAAAGLCLFLATSCGDAQTAPRISDLRVEPAGVRAGETLIARVDFADDDGDLGGGAAELSLRHDDAPEGQLFIVALKSDVEATKGTVTLTLRVPVMEPPGPHELSVALVDATERRSPPLVAELLVVE
ncbi:hypothetical protein L6R52_21330 [Myxococcota bacterium]|nr:hypothetical protein [Myxococcota bacterium]